MSKLVIMALIYGGIVSAVAVLARHANPRWSDARIATICALPLPVLGLLYAVGAFLYVQSGGVAKVGDAIPFAMFAMALLAIVSLLSAASGFAAAFLTLKLTAAGRPDPRRG